MKSLLTLIPDLTAPVAVPFALLFTKWSDEHLPRLFWMWDNDASINGDVRTDDLTNEFGGWDLKPVPLDDIQESRDMCYWAKGHHPRSFYARWVWLGLRNRASALSQSLGTGVEGPATYESTRFGYVKSVNGKFRYFEVIPVGPVVIRLHYGYKVPHIPGESKAPPVAIGFSVNANRQSQ